MKVAILMDIRYETFIELMAGVEEAINSVGGRLIYTKISSGPLQIIDGGDDNERS